MRASWLPSSLAGIWWRKIWLLPVATWFPTHSILWWVDDVLIFSDESQQVHQGKHYPWVVCTALASSGWSWNDLRCICLQEFSVLICSVPALENKKVLNPVLILHYMKHQVCCQQQWSLEPGQLSEQAWSCNWGGEKCSRKSCNQPSPFNLFSPSLFLV